MSADSVRYPPPNEPAAFESLCLDLWKEIWGYPGAQKNGRSGQPQAGVDVFGRQSGGWVGVQCKQKDGLLRSKVTVADLNAEVDEAKSFKPPLSTFIVATSGPRDGKVQDRAREITEDHEARGLFAVQVWSWDDIWQEIYGREELLKRILPVYWPRTSGATQRVEPSRLRHQAQHLFGRDDELARLEVAWHDPAVHVVTIVAWGGIGKTSLVAEWAARLAARSHDGADFFDWSFYSQGTREQGAASSDPFVAAALEFFGGGEGKALANSPTSPWDKGARLAQLVRGRRALLVLDGLEPLQHPPGPLAGQLKDPAIIALLKGLAGKNAGLCVVTTREGVADLASFRGSTAPEWKLERLSTPAGVALLTKLGVRGTAREMQQLVEDVRGHALTLNLLGRFLRDAHGGDIRKRDLVRFQEADDEVQGGHAFKVMEAYERWLGGPSPQPSPRSRGARGPEEGARGESEEARGQRMLAVLRLLGLFDRPASADCLAALRKAPVIPSLTEPLVGLSDAQWSLTVSRLAEAGLVSTLNSVTMSSTRERLGEAPFSGTLAPRERGEGWGEGALDAHPLVREHFAHRLHREEPEAWHAAHGRLFDHLKDTTEFQPDTLEGLQPLYQAVAHGCQAERYEEARVEVLYNRIFRGTERFSSFKLGAIGADVAALAYFFETAWSRVSPALTEAAQAWLLNKAAFRLRALGRLTDALEPMRLALAMRIQKEAWVNAAPAAGNLSELELALGDLCGALREAEQSVVFADRSSDAFQRMSKRTTLADALHQAGRRNEAYACFRVAEQLQSERQPCHPLLYSLWGFRYCDLLLAEHERLAWQVTLSHVSALPKWSPQWVLSVELWRVTNSSRQEARPSQLELHKARSTAEPGKQAEDCREVEKRVLQTLAWTDMRLGLLTVALDHLTLGRASLYQAIPSGTTTLDSASEVSKALDSLRRGGRADYLPLGLLTRAWLRSIQEDPESARADLDEAQEIAERGPMPLFLADVHLHRARLFRDPAALAAARTLVEKHGYGRRREELEDAEEAAREQGW